MDALARLGAKFQLEINWYSPQVGKLFDEKGQPICTVYAQGEWGRVAHTIGDRIDIGRLLNAHKLYNDPNKGLIGSYRAYLEGNGMTDKKARKHLAKVEYESSESAEFFDISSASDPPEYEVSDDDFDFNYISQE